MDRHVDPSQDWVRLTCLKPDAPGRGNHKKSLVVGGNLFFFLTIGWVIYIYIMLCLFTKDVKPWEK